MNREQKRELVDALHAEWSRASAGVVVHYRGLSVAESGALRRALHDAGISFRVVKNTLARRAARETGFAAAEPLFSGPIAVACGDDPVAMAKAIADFAKEHEALVVRGGVLDGKLIDAAQITALASLPSREVLLAKLLGSMQAPISGFVRVLGEVPASFVRALAAIRDQKRAAEPA
ncbi:MAG: 50S ribosomal protein L10 [Zetaproteobacteria bacterium]|nr:MAG: 50S ribosomal protein L10 [Zetaproteobacteria bacterium]